LNAHKSVAIYLCKRSSEDQAYDVGGYIIHYFIPLNIPHQSARELTAATWGQELALVLRQYNLMVTSDDEPKAKLEQMLILGRKVKEAMQGVWKDPGNDIFDTG
jgi:cohesin loading factor subunit SCC2